ncbi:MAG: Sapep family Mn(2+)-dependent dipeptidase [Eggerthellaceae bacterium]|nr:Sapep family Mn(2+)-dependent dipeptidase [Eggerthellaceae bacterium]
MDATAKPSERFDAEIERYLDDHWDQIIDDLRTLVRIESVDESSSACEGAPYGPGPRKALDAILRIADRMGFATHDLDGYIAYADWPGETETQLGIICHVDVVPAGPGWTFTPFELTEHEGYLVGRGVSDDKGPLVICLHALKFWKEKGVSFPYSIRFIFGADEEVGMHDVAYYRAQHPDPAFLFTPDAEFPVCYGEKGIYQATVKSKPICVRAIESIEGGMTVNAVPGEAHATLIDALRSDIVAKGRTAHASTPDLGVNAIGLLANALLGENLASEEERVFLEFVKRLCESTDGSAFNIACADEDFGALTICGGMIRYADGIFTQTIDIRYPTAISSQAITDALTSALSPLDVELTVDNVKEPFLIDSDSPSVQALTEAYEQITGCEAKPFTMGGGTYAREFTHAASFGMETTGVKRPEWVGGMHGPDEAISIAEYKDAFKIYAFAIAKLMESDITA